MKGRAKPPSSPESEESWTVECPCGVSFDDGEEMVDCDECGVWVHTSCCRILKGHTSYVCDKCKFKKKKETEESEVAQLLVELPSKTPPLEDKVFSLRREQLSIEERAHVQGVPGGDPEFFVGVSPVFSRQLWKCTGYVPKMFQFAYNELPEIPEPKVSILFGQYIEKQGDKGSNSSDLVKGEYQQHESGKMDVSYVLDTENCYSPKEKHNEFEPRREYKHRHRFQQDDNGKAHYQSKRRRDDANRKDSISKKRTKNSNSTPTTDTTNQYGVVRKVSQDDPGLFLKPGRTTLKNLKTARNVTIQNFGEDIDSDSKVIAVNPSKVEIGSEHRPDSPDRHVTGAESGTAAALNDEELALLLHQELNSSPRVGRVPRGRQVHPFSSKRPGIVSSPATPNASQKDHQPIYRRKNRDELQGEVFLGVDDQIPKNEVSGDGAKQDNGVLHMTSKKEKDMTDSCALHKVSASGAATDTVRHSSPASGIAVEGLSHLDACHSNELIEVDKRISTENILTLPGLIEEILNEKGHNVSYDFICEEVLPHWSKLRKHNGERYAYSSHRQAVLDCLRNRSAWSHLIDRGPKTNLGRKRRRTESLIGGESDNADQLYGDDGDDNHRYTRASREAELDGSEAWPPSDSNKDVNLAPPEEVPKGKRRARQGRRSALRSKGQSRRRSDHGQELTMGEPATGMEDDHVFSPFSDDISSSSEEDRILTHRSVGSRCHGNDIDNEDDELDN